MSKERELLRAALDFLYPRRWVEPEQQQVLDVLTRDIEELLAQPEQEAVAWMNSAGSCFLSDGNKYSENWTALYTEPPKRETGR